MHDAFPPAFFSPSVCLRPLFRECVSGNGFVLLFFWLVSEGFSVERLRFHAGRAHTSFVVSHREGGAQTVERRDKRKCIFPRGCRIVFLCFQNNEIAGSHPCRMGMDRPFEKGQRWTKGRRGESVGR